MDYGWTRRSVCPPYRIGTFSTPNRYAGVTVDMNPNDIANILSRLTNKPYITQEVSETTAPAGLACTL